MSSTMVIRSSDIGGYMGLLLGLSFFGVFKFLIEKNTRAGKELLSCIRNLRKPGKVEVNEEQGSLAP